MRNSRSRLTRTGWVVAACLALASVAHGQYVFWATGESTIMRSDLDGNGAAPIFNSLSIVYAFTVNPVDHQLYVSEWQNMKVLDFNGSVLMNIAQSRREGLAFDAFERDLYSGEFDVLLRHDVDTWTSVQLSQGRALSLDLYLPGKVLFYCSIFGASGDVYRFDLETLQSTKLADGYYYQVAVDPVHQWQFVVSSPDEETSSIMRSSLVFFDPTELYTGPAISGIAVDALASKVYWPEREAGRIMRMDLDGQNQEVVLGGQDLPREIAIFHPTDCNGNSIDDWCDASCGKPGGPCDVPGCGTQPDCDRNGVLDACEVSSDCNANMINDRCELYDGSAEDCNNNLVLDECETAGLDCNENLIPDDCDLAEGNSADCNGNLAPDECDISSGDSQDADANGVPDECCPLPCPAPALLPNDFGTCMVGSYFECDVSAQDCMPERGACERCGQVRYISFEIPANDVGMVSAIRIRLDSLHHPMPPPVGVVPSYSLLEGKDRYLNTIPNALSLCCDPNSSPLKCNTSASCSSDTDCSGFGVNSKCFKHLCTDSTVFVKFFRCARVGCAPEYRDWSDFSGSVIYATAETVLPSSSYSLSQLPPSCQGNEADCATASPPLVVTTERWTNVDCSNSSNGVPNASDLARVVDKIKEWPGSFIEPRLHIRAPLLDGMSQVNAQDAGRAVDAVKGLQYPFSIKCTTSTACVANAECVSPATCSANGWCTTVKDPCSGLCQP